MNKVFIWFFSITLLLLTAACKPGGAAVSARENEILDSLKLLNMVGYNRGGVSFTLAELEGLKAVSRDSVPWAYLMQENEDNGQIIYFFFPGYARDLASPQIRLEYMSKHLKGCSSADSLLIWLKSIYVSPDQRGEILAESELPTLDGQNVTLLEIRRPQLQVEDSLMYSEKHMAWAYADQGDRLIGFSLTTVTNDEYAQSLPLFKHLIRSYKAAK